MLNDIVTKCFFSTSRSLEQVSRTKLHLMAAIEDSPERQFNWLKFVVDSIVNQTLKLSYDGTSFVKKEKILFGTKMGFLIENLLEDREYILSEGAFPKTKVMFRKGGKSKKERPSESSVAEEVEEEET